jgi:serine/threonine protein kinase/tetratricopeptide (TPR) repeat protein
MALFRTIFMPGDTTPFPDAAAQWQLISEIVDGALDLQGEARVEFLNTRCGYDVDLRKEVDHFLAACDLVSRSPTFLKGRPHLFLNDLASDVESREAAAHRELQERVRTALSDKFDIGDVLGSGGAATVFRATDKFTGGVVALKVLHPELSHSIGSERFLREVRIVASLRHPNIIPLLSAGLAGDLPYYVMPCIEGQTLRARLQREPQLPTALVVSIAKDVAAALDAAHARGILHRDIKPQNILLDGDRALVADFGIARAIETAGNTLTESGTVIGTPGYMSPEQVSGEPNIDARSDVYSLACVVYEMLAGEPPFTGAQSRALLAKQLWAPVPDVRVLRTSLPPAVSDVLQHALAKNAADRLTTANVFLRGFEAAIADPILSERRRSPIARRWAFAAAVLATSGIGGWAAFAHNRSAEATLLASADSSRLVAFPTDVKGSPAFNNDSELAHASIARWSDVTAVSDHAVRERLGSSSGSLSTREAREISLQFHAGRYVRSTAHVNADHLRVSAELFDVHNPQIPLGRASREVLASPNALTTALAYVVDAVLLRTADTMSIGEGTLRTRSLAARQSFLRGNEALQQWRLAEAESAFVSALRFDRGYAQAALRLALTRLWAGKDSATWVSAAEASSARREALPGDDQQMTDALLMLARGNREGACDAFSAIADANPSSFDAWFSAAHCLESDDIVVADRRTPTHWRFRTSLHTSLARHRRAFALRPAVLGSLRDDQFRRLRRLLFTNVRDVRLGRLPGQRSATFAAYPSLDHDTLAFTPVPLAAFAKGVSPGLATISQAMARQRFLLGDIATEWAQTSPNDPLAHELVALSLCLAGNRSALDTLDHAYRLATDQATRTRIGVSRVWMAVQLSFPSDLTQLRRARMQADSLLARVEGGSADALALSGVAALLGRARLSDSIEARLTEALDHPEQAVTARLERRLSLVGVLGGPREREVALKQQVREIVGSLPAGTNTDSVRNRIYRRAYALGSVNGVLSDVGGTVDSTYYLVRVVKDVQEGTFSSARAILAEQVRMRRRVSLPNISLDVLLVESAALSHMGENKSAADWLDPAIGEFRTSVPAPDAIIGAATIRAMILRADIAHALGDDSTAARLGGAVAEFWQHADSFLQPTVVRMRSYAAIRSGR